MVREQNLAPRTQPGEVIAGRYEIDATAGPTTAGVRQRAVDRETGTVVAVKMLSRATADGVSALKREFRLLQTIRHPNIVQVFDLVSEADRWMLAMEWVEGADFASYSLGSEGGFDEGRLRAALRQLCSAVAALHDSGIVHRALSAATVVVTRKGRVAIIDFDLATARDSQILLPGAAQLGPVLSAPAAEDVGPERDWFGVGAILHHVMTALTERSAVSASGTALREEGVSDARAPFASWLPPDLVALCGDLLRADPKSRPTANEILDRVGVTDAKMSLGPGPAGGRLVGRDQELQWLADALAASRPGEPVTAVLIGESGIGKSAVVAAFAERLRVEHTGALVLLSRCYEREFVPFQAFDGAISSLVATLLAKQHHEVAPWLSTHAGILPRLFPEFGAIPLISERAAQTHLEDPLLARRLGFDALRELFRGLATQGPVLLAIDDVQWSDADSLALLRSLLEPPGAPPILVVCTLRVAAGSAAHGTDLLERVPGDVRTLRLDRLKSSDASEVVAELVAREGMTALRPDEVRAMVEESGGHPMFLAELVHHRRGEFSDAKKGRVDDVIRTRVGRLEARARRFLDVVCVAAVPTDRRVVAEAASVGRTDLNRVVATLVAERLIQTSRSATGGIVEPYHNRIREAVVSALSAEQLRGSNAKLALAYELVGALSQPERSAEHWVKAEAPDRAKPYMISAAEKAQKGLAFDQAARYYAQAVELSDSPEEQVELRLLLAETLTNANRWREAAEIRLDLALTASPQESLRLRRVASEQLLCCGRFDKGIIVLREVMRSVGVYVPTSPLMTIFAVLFVRMRLATRMLRGTPRSVRRPELTERVDALLSAGYGLAMTDTGLGAYLNTLAFLTALDAGDPVYLARALFTEACYSANTGFPTRKKTVRLLERLREVVTAVEGPLARAYVEGPLGWYHYFHLEWVEATRHLLRAAAIFGEECVGQFWAQNTMYSLAFRAMVYLGEYRELRARSAKVLSAMEQVGDLYGISNLKAGALAWLRLVDDNVETSDRELVAVAETLPTGRFVLQTYFLLVSRAQLELYAGRHQAAYAALEREWTRLSRSLLLRISTLAVVAYDLRGRAALASLRDLVGLQRDRRMRDVATMIRRLEAMPYACAFGHASLLRAGVALSQGKRGAAAIVSERAAAAYDQAAMRVHAAAARWCQGACLGGESGATMVAAARGALQASGVVAPGAFVAMLAPAISVADGRSPAHES